MSTESAVSPAAVGEAASSTVSELHQRDRMLIGMAQTIAKHGYRGATITEVVRFARVSKRTFYEEFGDKESCFLELYEKTAKELEGLILAASAKAELDWREQIRAGAHAYFSALAIEPMLTKAFFIEIGTLSERATQARRSMLDHFCVLLSSIVDEARKRNPDVPSRPLPPMLAAAVVGGMTDVMIGALERDQYVESVDDLVETATDLLASVITGQFPPGTSPA
ncbi:MAG: TetR/AcrR family transcriptional regulator [Solirubrobacteraceae bacterium]|nr:TetR/AcrR family transcriptional regulator [Solirubrobacteraceae bacterium]